MDIAQEFSPLIKWLGEGTAPQYGSFLILLVMAVGLFVKFRLGAGEIGVRADQVRVEASKVEDEADGRLRDHFGKELERLAKMVEAADKRATEAHDQVELAKERQRQCEDREAALRKRVRALEDKLTGVVRSLAVEGSLRVLDITDHPSDDVIKAAISSLENIIVKRNRSEEPKA